MTSRPMRGKDKRFFIFQNHPVWMLSFFWSLIGWLTTSLNSEEYLEIRPGNVIPKILWIDNTFKVDLEIVNVSKTHVVLREGDNYLTIKHEHLLSLYETTNQNLTSAKIYMEANNLGGVKPGIPSKRQIEPGYIFPKLVWTNGRIKQLVEVLNIKQGYYVLRVDGKTAALSQENFLKILQKTKDHFKGNVNTAIVQPEQKKPPLKTVSKPLPASPHSKPKSSGLGAPPAPSKVPGSSRKIEFDFKFAGDSAPPKVKE